MRTQLVALFLAASTFSASAFAQTAAPAKPAASAKPSTGAPARPGASATPPPATPAEPAPPPAPPGPPPLADALTGDAKADYESGKLLFGDGDFAGALVKFTSAYEKSKEPRLLWNMAACEKNLRRYSRSLKLVRTYLAEGGAVLTDDDRREANELIKVMEPLTAKLRINVDEPGAEVSIDDEPVGTSPVEPVVVDIGARKIRVTKPEFEPVIKEVPVGGAAEVVVDAKLAKIVHEGRLTVRAPANAAIAIDDRVVGSGTWSGTLPSGGHTLRVTAPKMRPHQTEVVIQDKQTRDLAVSLEPEPSKGGVPAWMWIAGGVVVAGGLGTAGFFIFRPEDKYEGPPGNLQPGIVQASVPVR